MTMLRWRPAGLSQGIAAVFVLLMAVRAVPAAPPPTVIGQLPVVLGHKMDQREADLTTDGPVARNLPIGQRIYRTVVELETENAGTVGEKVDVAHVTLGDEGPVAKTILRGILVVSNKPTTGAASDVLPTVPTEPVPADTETDEPAGHPEFYETRLVGLAVTGGQLEWLRMAEAQGVLRIRSAEVHEAGSLAEELLHNFVTNLFQPLLLFFFMGFLVPILKVPFEFPKALYQSLVIYLLIAIGWHGGELMAHLSSREIAVAGGLAAVGFVTNAFIGYLATVILRRTTRMRQIDAVTVGAYYGSDSAGTFVTCLGILSMLSILHDSYMPVMLAVMEIPGCLIGLFLISRLRRKGMDPAGNMPGEAGYTAPAKQAVGSESILSPKILHEVFLNPGLFMLFGGIVVGFISGVQALKDPSIVEGPNHLFLFIFKGALCLFLLEMGMTASQRLQDLKTAGIGFIIFGLLGPVLFATLGMLILHGYSLVLGHAFELGTYALFAVLCGAASYIAVPAVQRIAIPEASPTLPLAASLGLTFTWNVTIGIPIYIEIARQIVTIVPVNG
jgi:hypothetical protein